jgi:hypothetical protein
LKSKTRGVLARVGSLFLVLCLAGEAWSGETQDQAPAKKSLKRKVDPVVVDGSLTGEVLGCPLANLRVYALHDGAFEPIRFQIDEMA